MTLITTVETECILRRREERPKAKVGTVGKVD
jgi:hypothetical protein